MPVKITNQMDTLLDIRCTKPRSSLVVMKRTQQEEASAATVSTPKKSTRARTDKKGRPAKPQSQIWYINSRNNEQKNPPEYKHRYRKAIYDAVVPNLTYWARKHGKDIRQSAFDKECCARLTYYEKRGNRETWEPVDLPGRKDPLPADVLATIKALRDATATSTDDEIGDAGQSAPSKVTSPPAKPASQAAAADESSGSEAEGHASNISSATSYNTDDYEQAAPARQSTSTATASVVEPPPPPQGQSTPVKQTAPVQQTTPTQLPQHLLAIGLQPKESPLKAVVTSSDAGGLTQLIDAMAGGDHQVIQALFPQEMNKPPTLYRAPTLNPFANLVMRLNEMSPTKYPLSIGDLKAGCAEGLPFSKYTAARYCKLKQPKFPEDDTMIEWLHFREQELNAAEGDSFAKGLYPTISATTQLRVNMNDYKATPPEKLPVTAPIFPDVTNTTGIDIQVSSLVYKLFPGEMMRVQEIARSQARISQCLRWVLTSPVGRNAPSEMRDTFHSMLDDSYKLHAELIGNFNRIQQRSMFPMPSYKDHAAQLYQHSVTATHSLFPVNK